MRRNLGIIAGATVVAATVFATTQTGLLDRPRPDAAPPADAAETPAPTAAPATVAQEPPAPDPALTAKVDRLAAELDRREAALAELEATLADRDAALADRDDELRALRAELAALRERYAFELQLAAVKAVRTEPAASRAAAPAPPPAGEAPMTAIHFETGSSRLTPGGQAHAAAAAVMLADMPLARIRVDGYADRTGDPERNRALAAARARSVADFLVAAGLPADRIETAGMTDPEMLPVATAAGVAEPLNRAATITPVPPPTT